MDQYEYEFHPDLEDQEVFFHIMTQLEEQRVMINFLFKRLKLSKVEEKKIRSKLRSKAAQKMNLKFGSMPTMKRS